MKENNMLNKNTLPRRDFLRNAVMLAGAGVTAPLWAAMKYDRDAALRHFRACASETEARVKRSLSNQLDRLKMSALWGWDYQYDYQKMIGSIKAADVRRLARKMASGDVLLEVYTEQ